MRIRDILFLSLVLVVLTLAGCGDKGKGDGSSDSALGSGYKEIEEMTLEEPVSRFGFHLDEGGDILFWGEDIDTGKSDEAGRYVWIEGDVKEVEVDVVDRSFELLDSGIIVGNKYDSSSDPSHSIVEYDPRSGDVELFPVKDGYDNFVHPKGDNYLPDSRTYVHLETRADNDDAKTYIWNINDDDITDLTFIADMKDLMDDKFGNYPHFYITEDVDTIYAVDMNRGIFAHDVDSSNTEWLYETDNIRGGMLSGDEKHVLYTTDVIDDDERRQVFYGFNVDNSENVEIGEGRHLHTLSNGNAVFVNYDLEVQHFDFETGKLETIYDIDLNENEELDNITFSSDGSTIAYGYTKLVKEGEDNEEDELEFVLKILASDK